jgi:CDP-glucose 4,6-dehydratase
MHDFHGTFREKTVLVTGHTGFKGSWLCEWLHLLGARVVGYALPAPTQPAMFDQLDLAGRIEHHTGDIRDIESLDRVVRACQPDFVFHLAAQPLVRLSYEQPLDTHAINVLGTANVLECLRRLTKPCAAVMITTDKCYENREWCYGYRENDPLGGHDPYSASKAAAEVIIASYQRSFFQSHPVRVASARAGNVIGGGDWALDRIVPDSMRSLAAGQPVPVRNKNATRPWQHVLEPLGGYLWLAATLANPHFARGSAEQLCSAFNFGPSAESNRSVGELVTEILKHHPGRWEDRGISGAVHEAKLLHLVTDKARGLLGWMPVWGFADTVRETVRWYRESARCKTAASLRRLTDDQIRLYSQSARTLQLPWTPPTLHVAAA